jgi:hypothetical protein
MADQKRLTNYLVFCGRAGAAVMLVAIAVLFALSKDPVGQYAALLPILGSICFLGWAAKNPLWMDISKEKVSIRWLFRRAEYSWAELRVYFVDETTKVKKIENVHRFANFRTKGGQWIKIRLNVSDSQWLAECMPAESFGRPIVPTY